jgi:hypothetical protein
MEPWDGPLLFRLDDGNVIGALLDEMVASFSLYLNQSGFCYVFRIGCTRYKTEDVVQHGLRTRKNVPC